MWGFTKFKFKQILKVSTFYIEKQKSFIPKGFSFLNQCFAQLRFWKSVSDSRNLLAGATAVLLETLFQNRSCAKHCYKKLKPLVNAIQNSYQKYSKLQITELPNRLKVGYISDYRKVVSSNTSRLEAHTHSRFRHYFCSNLYGSAPRGPRGVKKSDFFFHKWNCFPFALRLPPKDTNFRNHQNWRKNVKKTLFS